MTHPVDRLGTRLSVNDTVEVEEIPDELIRGLPKDDQEAIKKKLGRRVQIVAFDDSGNAELEFTEPDSGFRTIWISPNCLIRV